MTSRQSWVFQAENTVLDRLQNGNVVSLAYTGEGYTVRKAVVGEETEGWVVLIAVFPCSEGNDKLQPLGKGKPSKLSFLFFKFWAFLKILNRNETLIPTF